MFWSAALYTHIHVLYFTLTSSSVQAWGLKCVKGLPCLTVQWVQADLPKPCLENTVCWILSISQEKPHFLKFYCSFMLFVLISKGEQYYGTPYARNFSVCRISPYNGGTWNHISLAGSENHG